MNAAPKTYREFVEHHIGLLDSLSAALEASRAAIVAFRVHDVERSLVEQKSLCVQISSLHNELRRAFPLAPAQGEAGSLPGDLPLRLQSARNRLQKINREQQALLSRSRRTVNAMLNGLRSFEGNYADEARKQTGASLRERA